MQDLLFEEFPPTPPGTGSQPKKAIILVHAWKYDDTANYVTSSLRNRIPDHLKTDGKLHLERGAEGYLYERSPDNRWGMAIFIVRCTLVHVVVPLSYLQIGVDFIPASSRKDRIPSLQNDAVPSVNYVAHTESLMDSVIDELWLTLRSRQSALEGLAFGADALDKIFGSDFQRNMDTMILGFLPAARRVFQHGDFSVNDILNIPHLPPEPGPVGPVVYIRVYHNESGVPPSAIYVGSTMNVWRRHQQHVQLSRNPGTPNNRGTSHYNCARHFAPEHCHMIPVWSWNHTIPPFALGMVEQTMILLLGAFIRPFRIDYNRMYPDTLPRYKTYLQRIRFLGNMVRDAKERCGWTNDMQLRGLNWHAPLAGWPWRHSIDCLRMQQFPQGAQTFTQYRTAFNWSKVVRPGLANWYTGKLRYIDAHGKWTWIHLSIPPADIELDRIPLRGFMVFEIMDNGEPHPNPWIRCPAVGPFEGFMQASSLGLRYEWHDKTRNVWLSISVHKAITSLRIARAVEQNDLGIVLKYWFRAFNFIQALKGVNYSGDPPSQGFHSRLTLGATKQIRQLETCHLTQTYQWIERPEVSLPFPKMATWQHNFTLMVRRFSSVWTYFPSEPIRSNRDFNRMIPLKCRDSSGKTSDKCDFCFLSQGDTSLSIPCTLDVSSPYGNVCRLCSLFNRPCSFTRQAEMLELWGADPPPLHHAKRPPVAKYPTGPLRSIAFYLTRHQGVRQVAKPCLERLAPFTRLQLEDDEMDGAEDPWDADGGEFLDLEMDE